MHFQLALMENCGAIAQAFQNPCHRAARTDCSVREVEPGAGSDYNSGGDLVQIRAVSHSICAGQARNKVCWQSQTRQSNHSDPGSIEGIQSETNGVRAGDKATVQVLSPSRRQANCNVGRKPTQEVVPEAGPQTGARMTYLRD